MNPKTIKAINIIKKQGGKFINTW